MDLPLGDMIVARLWRWDGERLRLDAERDRRVRLSEGEEDPDFSISVWGLTREADDSIEGLKARLREHVRQFRTAKWIVFTSASRLREVGFDLRPSGPPGHYDVILGSDPNSMPVDALAMVFNEEERERF